MNERAIFRVVDRCKEGEATDNAMPITKTRWEPDPAAPPLSEVVEMLRAERQNRESDAERARIEGAEDEAAEHEQQMARLDAMIARLEPGGE